MREMGTEEQKQKGGRGVIRCVLSSMRLTTLFSQITWRGTVHLVCGDREAKLALDYKPVILGNLIPPPLPPHTYTHTAPRARWIKLCPVRPQPGRLRSAPAQARIFKLTRSNYVTS